VRDPLSVTTAAEWPLWPGPLSGPADRRATYVRPWRSFFPASLQPAGATNTSPTPQAANDNQADPAIVELPCRLADDGLVRLAMVLARIVVDQAIVELEVCSLMFPRSFGEGSSRSKNRHPSARRGS
jgi:hypothetical protein